MRRRRALRSGKTLFALVALLAISAGVLTGCSAEQQSKRVILFATATSAQDSGLLDLLVPLFEANSTYRVKTIAVGTGEALAMARRGDADVVLTHAPAIERAAIEAGDVLPGRVVMVNDFLVVGPTSDPAGVRGTTDATAGFGAIADSLALFVSRADGSGTHDLEQRLWRAAGKQPDPARYLKAGQGMGATLQIASEKSAYTLVDRGTYLAFQGKIRLTPAVEGDPQLENRYSVLQVSPERSASINRAGAEAFADFLVGHDAQAAIAIFGVARFGQRLFHPFAAASGLTSASG